MAGDGPVPAVDSKDISCSKCAKPFDGFTFVDIANIKRLRVGSAIVYDLRMACIHCGAMFHYHESDKRMEDDAEKFIQIIGLLHGHK